MDFFKDKADKSMKSLLAKKDALVAKVDQKKTEYQEKRAAKWRTEVLLENNSTGWKAVYEPEDKDDEEEKGEDSIVKKKVLEKMSNDLKIKITRMLMQVISQVLAPVEGSLTSSKEFCDLINACGAVVLTYRFQSHGKKRMTYFKNMAVDKMAISLCSCIEVEAEGKDVATLDAAAIETAINKIVSKISTVLNEKQEQAKMMINTMPIFASATVATAGGEADPGVVALQAFLRSYLESKIGIIMPLLKGMLSTLLSSAVKYQASIKKYSADFEKNQYDEDAEVDPEYSKARADLMKVVDDNYARLDTSVATYVNSIVQLLASASAAEEQAQE